MADYSSKTAILSKIKKLIGLASNNRNVHEAAAAAAKAQELLFRHKLSLLEVEVASADIVEIDRLPIRAQWRRLLAANLCRYSFCRLLVSPGVFRFIGAPHDLDVVLYLYTYLSRTIVRLALEAWQRRVEQLTDPVLGPHPILKEPGHEAQWKGSFNLGVVEAIVQRLATARRAQEQEPSVVKPTAEDGVLIVVERSLVLMQQRVDDYVAGKYKTTDGEPPKVDLRVDGFLSGTEAGRRVPLSKGIGGHGSGPVRGALR